MPHGDLADLIDRLCIANLKIWHLEDQIRDSSLSDEEVGRITRTLFPVNEERARLKNLINSVSGLGGHDPKLYPGSAGSAGVDG